MKFFYFLIVAMLLSAVSYSQTSIYPSINPQVETPIAVNPTNPSNLIAGVITQAPSGSGANHIGVYYSTDGGSTWAGSENFTGPDTTSAGDPVIAFDPDGKAYFVYQIFTEGSFYMRTSTDGGQTWAPSLSSNGTKIISVTLPNQIDRPSIAISPVRNGNGYFNIYVSCSYFSSGENTETINLFRSTDGGTSFTFAYSPTPPVGRWYAGTSLAVGSNGEVFLGWGQEVKPHLPVDTIIVQRSTDQGSNFFDQIFINVNQIGNTSGSNYYVKGGNVRADSYPRIAVDQSPNNPGSVYIVWSSAPYNYGGYIYMLKGTVSNNQFSWGSVSTIASENKLQWCPAITVNNDGVVSLSYYSSDTTYLGAIYTHLRYSSDGGSSFSSSVNIGISGGFVLSTNNIFLGDYFGITSWYGKAYCLFTQTQTNPNYAARQAYFNYYNIPTLTEPSGYKKVVVDQVNSSGVSSDKFGEWNQNAFTNYTPPYTFMFPLNNNQVIRAKQDFLSGTSQKYNNWNVDNNIINPRNFLITSGTAQILSHFNHSVSSVTIENNLLDSPGTGLSNTSVGFQDPWFNDSTDASYANSPSNRISPVMYTRSSPFYPNYSTAYNGYNYKGVLLNQDYNIPGNPYYTVSFPSNQTISVGGTNHTLYFQGWAANPSGGATFQNAGSAQTPVVFLDSTAVVLANVKAAQLSSQTNAIANNSQRKIVRTPDGYLHLVYESLGHVWLETSQDNGATWQLMNNGLPLDNGEGKLPSIDWTTDSTSALGPIIQFLVIYQEQSSTGFVIKLKLFEGIDGGLPYLKDSATVDSVTNDTYSTNVNPAISYDKNHVFIAVWERKAGTTGLYFRAGAAQDNDGITFSTSAAVITGTSSYSENPAIAVCKGYGQTTVRQLAWDESNTIRYAKITPFGLSSTIQNISSGDGFTLNYNPSIIALTDSTARVCWAGDLDGTGSIVQAVFHDPGYYRYWDFGSIIKSPTVTFSDDNSRYVVSWNETLNNSNANKFTDSRTLSAIYDLGINGNAVQISNGATVSNMYGTVFNSSTAPYYFSTSNSIGSIAPKVNANAANSGRGVVLTKDNAQFYFMLGNISVDNSPVSFIDVPRKVRFDSLQELNNCIITAPFSLGNNSNFSYSVLSGITDTAAAVSELGKNGFVTFVVELIDDATGDVICSFDNLQLACPAGRFDRENIHKLNSQSFQVNTAGIAASGSRTVRLALVVNSNLMPDISAGQTKLTMIDSYSNGSIMGKSTSKPISYQGTNKIKSYRLDQNYPNPFNPSTIIHYEIPNDGLVTLKIYDELGREVKTLVNQYQNKGRYDINFDAGNLASGIYFYRLNVINPANQSQNYTAVKKMLMIK